MSVPLFPLSRLLSCRPLRQDKHTTKRGTKLFTRTNKIFRTQCPKSGTSNKGGKVRVSAVFSHLACGRLFRKSIICGGKGGSAGSSGFGGLPSAWETGSACNSSRSTLRSVSSSTVFSCVCKIALATYALRCPCGTLCSSAHAAICSVSCGLGRKENAGRACQVPGCGRRRRSGRRYPGA